MDTIDYVGHATVLMDLGGTRLLTDPLLRRWVGPLRRYAAPVTNAAVHSPHAVLLSHMHLDHVDRGSLARIDRSATVLVPAAGRNLVESVGFERVVVVSAGTRMTIGDVDITVVPAHHDGRRHPMARDGESVGYLLVPAPERAPSASPTGEHTTQRPATTAPPGAAAAARPAATAPPRGVYFPGDTSCFDGMIGFADVVDVTLMPVWGWGTSVDEDEHMTPLSAARCLSLIRPHLVIPIHWGTYSPPAQARLRRFDQTEPPRAFARYAAHLQPDIEVRILQPGESTAIGERPPETEDPSRRD